MTVTAACRLGNGIKAGQSTVYRREGHVDTGFNQLRRDTDEPALRLPAMKGRQGSFMRLILSIRWAGHILVLK